MKVAIYPGSFNPWHNGHDDILNKALQVFDKIVVARGVNPEKSLHIDECIPVGILKGNWNKPGDVFYLEYEGLLKDIVINNSYNAIIRGLRNAQDLEYETVQQYWNEDLGITIPTFYVITDRKLRHISSSAIRQVEKFKK